jgi:hypothetical protein
LTLSQKSGHLKGNKAGVLKFVYFGAVLFYIINLIFSNELMIRYHKTATSKVIAEILPGPDLINTPEDMLDIMAEAGYNNSTGIIIHNKSLNHGFFDLKSGLAGEILQKFSNYRMRLAIIGDFSGFKSRSLRDFIRESNDRGTICFVDSLDKALARLS